VITLNNQPGSLNCRKNNDMVLGSSPVITRKFVSSPSIGSPGCVSTPSLANLLAIIEARKLPERKRQELASAIRTVARAIGRSPEDISADARSLGNRLKGVSPAAIGISRERWNNVRCLARSALALIQPISPGRNRNDLLPEWDELTSELTSRSDKIALSRVLHFLSSRAIGPTEVTEKTLDEYRGHLHDSLLKRPAESFTLSVKAWRRAAAAIAGWPEVEVSIPDRRKRWVSGWDAFPESLRHDCEKWCDRLAGRDLLEDAPFRPVRPATLDHREWQIRAFATAAARMGRDPATLASLSDLVEIKTFRAALRFFLHREGGTPTTAIADIASVLKSIARHHVHVKPEHLEQMAGIVRRLAPGRSGLTETNRTRLRSFDDRHSIDALLRLPTELMRQARRHPNPQRGAVRAQMAVAIEILLMAPLRLKNLVSLDVERNLVRPGKGRAVHIVIAEGETKNREPLEFPLPPESVALLDRYLVEFRPLLASRDTTALFPGISGGAKNQAFFGTQISRVIRAHSGLVIHPHLFRHIGAKLYLDTNPGAYEVVRRVLGHKSIDTTVAFYTGLETASAVRHFDQTILTLRQENNTSAYKRGGKVNGARAKSNGRKNVEAR
jgi:integrase